MRECRDMLVVLKGPVEECGRRVGRLPCVVGCGSASHRSLPRTRQGGEERVTLRVPLVNDRCQSVVGCLRLSSLVALLGLCVGLAITADAQIVGQQAELSVGGATY